LSFPENHSIQYISKTEEANVAVGAMIAAVLGERGGGVVRLDAELNCDGGPSGRGPGVICVLQLSSQTDTLVLHLSRMRVFPHMVRALLVTPTLIKASKSTGGDCKKLREDFGAPTVSTI